MNVRHLLLTATCATILSALPGHGIAAETSNGGELFRRYCQACHTLDRDRNRVGPHLSTIVGRPAGAVSTYSYSAALRASGLIWTSETLDEFLKAPSNLVAGTRMIFAGITDAAQRAAIIAFLKDQ